MRISQITFGNKIETRQDGNIKYKKEFSDNGHLLSAQEWLLPQNRPLKIERFNQNGDLLEIQEFSYFPNKTVEHYKNKYQEYTRTISEEIKNGFKHITENFISKTSPKSNYTNETIKELSGKLVQIIANGKQLL